MVNNLLYDFVIIHMLLNNALTLLKHFCSMYCTRIQNLIFYIIYLFINDLLFIKSTLSFSVVSLDKILPLLFN